MPIDIPTCRIQLHSVECSGCSKYLSFPPSPRNNSTWKRGKVLNKVFRKVLVLSRMLSYHQLSHVLIYLMIIRFLVNLVVCSITIFVYGVARFNTLSFDQEPLDNGILRVDLRLVDAIMSCLVGHRRIGTCSDKDLDGFKVSVERRPMKRRIP